VRYVTRGEEAQMRDRTVPLS